MISSLPIMSLKFKDFKLKNNLPKYILIGVAIISLVILKWLAVPVIFIIYVVLSLLFKNKIA
jgi:CDP-diacylglycerol--serine O-phosphatidyltransferase